MATMLFSAIILHVYCLWLLVSETSPQTWYSVEGDIVHSGRLHMPCASFPAIPSDPSFSFATDGLSVNDCPH